MSPQRKEFLEVVSPWLSRGDGDGLRQAVAERWQSKEICPLLFHRCAQLRQTAAVVLGLVGDRGCVGCLARGLHDPEAAVAASAEDSLWAVWFRLGSAPSCSLMREAMAHQDAHDPKAALKLLKQAIAVDPDFAEPYNQAAICLYLQGEWATAVGFCDQTLRRMPMHFGAAAGKGHCLIEMGDTQSGVAAYRRALEINPRLTEIRKAIGAFKVVR